MPLSRSEIYQRYYQKNKDKVNERQRLERQTPHAKARRRAWDAANQHKRRDKALCYKYGLQPGEFEKLLEAQDRKCAICRGDKPRGRNWHVDHDHETGLFRGILCKPCNTALGSFGDTVEGVQRALDYLKTSEIRRHRE